MNEDLTTVYEDWPYVRIQQHIKSREGIPVEFVIQLEYNMNPDMGNPSVHDWRQVARFDHRHGGAHDVRYNGLHMDVYKQGHKYRIARNFPGVPIEEAPQYCLDYFKRRLKQLVSRFERLHDIDKEELIENR